MTEALGNFKQEWRSLLAPESIRAICKENDLSWRERVLDPVTAIQLQLLQVLHGNAAISHLPSLSNLSFTPAAYCLARQRIPVSVFEQLFKKVTSALEEATQQMNRWRGHRVFVADGTGVSMSDTEKLQEEFGQPPQQKSGCGFPVAHLNVIMNLGTGVIRKFLCGPLHQSDISRVRELHTELESGDIFLADRGYCSFAHVALLTLRELNAVIRIGGTNIIDFTPERPFVFYKDVRGRTKSPRTRWVSTLGKCDQIVEWFNNKRKPSWISAEQFAMLPDSITVRELQYCVSKRGFRSRKITIVTTLLDPKHYPAKEIAKLYGLRWQIETNFRHLKITMGMDVLRCKTVEGIRKELLAYSIVYNLVRLVMLHAAAQQRVPPERISFVDALRWLISSAQCLQFIPLTVVPLRKGRYEPRNVKRRRKAFPYLVTPRKLMKLRTLTA